MSADNWEREARERERIYWWARWFGWALTWIGFAVCAHEVSGWLAAGVLVLVSGFHVTASADVDLKFIKYERLARLRWRVAAGGINVEDSDDND